MGHGGGGREMQRALESQAQQQAAGGGESYQGGEGPGRLKKIILLPKRKMILKENCSLDIFSQSPSAAWEAPLGLAPSLTCNLSSLLPRDARFQLLCIKIWAPWSGE